MKNRIIYAVVVLVAILSVGLMGFYSGYQQGKETARYEFYRGSYATCLWFAVSVFWMPLPIAQSACSGLVSDFISADAYSRDY